MTGSLRDYFVKQARADLERNRAKLCACGSGVLPERCKACDRATNATESAPS